MAKHGDDRSGNLVCSFCGKSQDEVRKLIAGPTVYICDECIDLCNDIIAEECDQEEGLASTSTVPKPADIKKVLDQYVIGQERAKKVLAVAVHNHYKRRLAAASTLTHKFAWHSWELPGQLRASNVDIDADKVIATLVRNRPWTVRMSTKSSTKPSTNESSNFSSN